MNEKIPEPSTTENIPFEKKILHRRSVNREVGFRRLIVELNRKSNLAFGYANLKDDIFAEEGYG